MVRLPEFPRGPIDIHSHFDYGSPCELPQKPTHPMEVAYLKGEYDRFDITHAGMSTYGSVMCHPECIVEENDYLHRLVQQLDWMYQWVVVDPRQEETYRQAEQMLKDPKVLGIKIHPKNHAFDIRDHGDGLFSFAERMGTVVLMHPQHILEMTAFADRYPGMKLIIAHLNSIDHVEAVANARYGNIYTDTSGSGLTRNNVLEYAVSRIGSKRILFGTDTYSCEYFFGRIALADLTLEDKENILWKNALQLFPNLDKKA